MRRTHLFTEFSESSPRGAQQKIRHHIESRKCPNEALVVSFAMFYWVFKKDRHIMQDVGFERWQLFHERAMLTRKAIAIRHE
jgi:hypothetical protein